MSSKNGCRFVTRVAVLFAILTIVPLSNIMAQTAPIKKLLPTDLAWKLVSSTRSDYAAVLEDQFVEFRDEFKDGLHNYNIIEGSGTISNGALSSTGNPLYICKSKSPIAPCVGLIIDVASNPSGTVSLGLVKDSQNSVLGSYNKDTKTISIDIIKDGKKTNLKTVPNLDYKAPVKFGVTVVSSILTVFVYTPEGHWQIICSRWFGNITNLVREDNIKAYKYAFGCSGDTKIKSFKAGYAGRVGARDPWLFILGNGAPVLDGDCVYLIWANESTYSNDDDDYPKKDKPAFNHSYLGIHKFNCKTYEYKEVSKIFFRRQSKGFMSVLTDNTGGIVWDRDGDGKFYVMTSPWGDYPEKGVPNPQIELAITSENLLSGVHVLDVEKLPQYGLCYDPGILKLGDTWYMFTNTSLNKENLWEGLRPPTLYKGKDLKNLQLVGNDIATSISTEGHHFQKIDGVWYAVAMQGNGRAYAYDLKMNKIGIIPPLPPEPSLQQPCLIAFPANGKTKYLWVNNDGTVYPYFLPSYGKPKNFYYENRGTILTLLANQELDHYDFKEWKSGATKK